MLEANGQEVEAFGYVADRIDDRLRPYDWYRDHVVRGAREHGLPSAYVDEQLDVEADRDPDVTRSRREQAAWGAAIGKSP